MRREHLGDRDVLAALGDAGAAQRVAGAVGPALRAEPLERLQRGAQLRLRVARASPAPLRSRSPNASSVRARSNGLSARSWWASASCEDAPTPPRRARAARAPARTARGPSAAASSATSSASWSYERPRALGVAGAQQRLDDVGRLHVLAGQRHAHRPRRARCADSNSLGRRRPVALRQREHPEARLDVGGEHARLGRGRGSRAPRRRSARAALGVAEHALDVRADAERVGERRLLAGVGRRARGLLGVGARLRPAAARGRRAGRGWRARRPGAPARPRPRARSTIRASSASARSSCSSIIEPCALSATTSHVPGGGSVDMSTGCARREPLLRARRLAGRHQRVAEHRVGERLQRRLVAGELARALAHPDRVADRPADELRERRPRASSPPTRPA